MFRVVDTAFWTDPRVRTMNPDVKLLFLYCITSSHAHASGIYYVPNVIVAHETGLPLSGLKCLWDALETLGMVRRDAQQEVVWVVNMLRYQGKGLKHVISASHHLKSLHKSFLCNEFAKMYPEVTTIKNGYRPTVQKIRYPDLNATESTTPDRVSDGSPPSPSPSSSPLSPPTTPSIPPPSSPPSSPSPLLADASQEPGKTEQPKRPRARTLRDDLFDAIVELTGVDPKTAGSGVGKVVTALLVANPPYTPDEVRSLPVAIASAGLSFTLTPPSIQKYIGWVRTPPTQTNAKEHGHASRRISNGVGPTSRVRAAPGKYDNIGITIHSTLGTANDTAARPPSPPTPDGGGAGPPGEEDIPLPRVG